MAPVGHPLVGDWSAAVGAQVKRPHACCSAVEPHQRRVARVEARLAHGRSTASGSHKLVHHRRVLVHLWQGSGVMG